MGKFILLFFSLFCFFGNAQTVAQKNYQPPSNLLSNGGFESGKAQWVNSGGTFAITTSSSNLLDGKSTASFDASSTGQYVETSLQVIPAGMYGQNCMAKIEYKGGDSNLALKVIDGSSNVIASQVFPGSATNKRSWVLNFVCPSSGSLKLRVESSANAAIVYLDKGHLGEVDNLINISQANKFGRIKWIGASCNWSITGNALFPSDSNCTSTGLEGNAQDPGTNQPSVKFASMPEGEYLLVWRGPIRCNETGGNGGAVCVIYMTDDAGTSSFESTAIGVDVGSGTSTGVGVGEQTFRYKRTSVGTNIVLQVGGNGIGTGDGVRFGTAYNGAGTDISLDVYYFPSSSQTVANLTQSQSIYSADFGFSSATSNANTFADMNVAGLSLNELAAQNKGSISPYSSGLGITFTPVQIGMYEICFPISFTQNTSAQNNSFVVYDDVTAIGQTQTAQVNSSSDIKTLTVCGIANAQSLSPKNIHVMFATSAGTMTLVSAGVTLKSISASSPAPVVVGGVVSSSSGTDRVERISFGGATEGVDNCTSSPCTIYRQSGFVSSVTRGGTGGYGLNFVAGTFSQAPTCVLGGRSQGVGGAVCYQLPEASSSSSIAIECLGLAGGSIDASLQVQCVGPK